MIRNVQVLSGGNGYSSPPTVNFSGGSGSSAAGVAVINENGTIIRVDLTDPGYDYLTAPTITFGNLWTGLTAVTIGQQYYFSNRLYTVTVAGTTGSVAPVHLSGATINSPLFAFSTALTLNSTVYVSNRLYKVTTAGTTSAATTPTHTTGTVTKPDVPTINGLSSSNPD
jgi:hypothetical protein